MTTEPVRLNQLDAEITDCVHCRMGVRIHGAPVLMRRGKHATLRNRQAESNDYRVMCYLTIRSKQEHTTQPGDRDV